MRYPGTKVDTMLVLRGPQGKRKSTFISTLFGEKYVKSQMPDLSSKDASLGLRGYACVEFAELDQVIRARENSTAKEFISRSVDSCRKPYGRAEEQFPRQCIFIGTTNDYEILPDTTGNRRYWIVEAPECDVEWVRENRDALWSAASSLERESYSHWFDDEARTAPLQKPYEIVDGWEDSIRDHCAGRPTVKSATDIYRETIARGDAGALARVDRRIRTRITATLRKLGCIERRSNSKHWWDVPETLQKESPSPEEARRRVEAEGRAKLKYS
jgi:predicted P-loop ATPase